MSKYYIERLSYLLYVKNSYDLINKFSDDKQNMNQMFEELENSYNSLSNSSGLVPIGDTSESPIDLKLISNQKFYHDGSFTVIRNKNFYCLINHDKNIFKYKLNHHLDFEFGNVIIYKGEEQVFKFNFYEGYQNKVKNKTYKLENKNVIINVFNKIWRFTPFNFQKIVYDELSNKIKINTLFSSREIEIYFDRIRIVDKGLGYSNFNINVNYLGNILFETGKIRTEIINNKFKRFKLYGKTRITQIKF